MTAMKKSEEDATNSLLPDRISQQKDYRKLLVAREIYATSSRMTSGKQRPRKAGRLRG